MTLDAEEARELLQGERDRQLERRRAAEEQLSQDQPDVAPELTTTRQHPGDVATGTHDREMAQGSVEQAEAELREIDAAFERLDEGTYGYCQADGEAIDPDRLRAQPTARYCVDHQREMEAQA